MVLDHNTLGLENKFLENKSGRKRFKLFDPVSAPNITRAARFCSLRILVKLSAEQLDQIVDPYNITCLIIAL